MKKPLGRRVSTKEIMERCDIKNRNTIVRFMQSLGVFPVKDLTSKRTQLYTKSQAQKVIREYKKLSTKDQEEVAEIIRLRDQLEGLRKLSDSKYTHTTERLESISDTVAHDTTRLDALDGTLNTIKSQGKHIHQQQYEIQELRDLIDSQGEILDNQRVILDNQRVVLDALTSAVQKLGGTILFEKFEKVVVESQTPQTQKIQIQTPSHDFMKAK